MYITYQQVTDTQNTNPLRRVVPTSMQHSARNLPNDMFKLRKLSVMTSEPSTASHIMSGLPSPLISAGLDRTVESARGSSLS